MSPYAHLLFYRASTRVDALPIRVTRAPDLAVEVSATRELSGAPGSILRISTGLSGPWPQGRVVIARAPMPGIGQRISIPVGTDAIDPADARRAMERELAELGLTPSEAAAFLTAWADELFGPPSTDAARRGAPIARPPQDVLLYWMPPSAIDAVATITVEPSAAALRRAFLVRVDLGAVVTAAPVP